MYWAYWKIADKQQSTRWLDRMPASTKWQIQEVLFLQVNGSTHFPMLVCTVTPRRIERKTEALNSQQGERRNRTRGTHLRNDLQQAYLAQPHVKVLPCVHRTNTLIPHFAIERNPICTCV